MPAGDEVDPKKRMYGSAERLVKIKIEGKEYEVPESLELLRCYQYLNFHIAFERFCWNASCENCAAVVKCKGKPPERMLCCQTPAEEGMVIEQLPEGIKKD